MPTKTPHTFAEEKLNRLGFSVVNGETLSFGSLQLKVERGSYAVSDKTGKVIGFIDGELPVTVVKKVLQFYLAGFQLGVSHGEDNARRTLRDWLNK